MAGSLGHRRISLLLQSRQSVQPVFSQVSVSAVDGNAVSRLRLHARLLSTAAPASGGRIQVESAVHVDSAVYCLRFSRLYEERDQRAAAAPVVHSLVLLMVVAGADDLFLDLPQHPLVPICILVRVYPSARSPTVREGNSCNAKFRMALPRKSF